MNIDSIQTGIVLDHITAKMGMDIYKYLKLDELDCTVAIIRNVKSNRMGRKDIIKIDASIDLNLDILGYLDPGVTVNMILNGKLIEKKKLSLPDQLVNVIHCMNPRCITSTEQEIDQIFYLADRQNRIYRCAYCEACRDERSR